MHVAKIPVSSRSIKAELIFGLEILILSLLHEANNDKFISFAERKNERYG